MKKCKIFCFLFIITIHSYGQLNQIISVSQPNCKDGYTMLAPVWPNQQGTYPKLVYNFNILPNGPVSSNQVSLELIYEQTFDGAYSDLVGNWMPNITRNTNQNFINADGVNGPEGISYAYNLVDPNQDCIDVSNGTLKLWARDIPPTEFRCVDYMQDNDLLADGFPNKREFKATAGEIWTLDLFKHGYFEAMIKIPYVDYVWPAFWLFHSANGKKTEIDIFEFVVPRGNRGQNCSSLSDSNKYYFSNEMYMTVHDWNLSVPPFDEESIEHVCRGFTGHAINDFHFFNTWHKYALYWDEYKCIWLVDDVPIAYLFKYYKFYYDQIHSLDLDYALGIWDDAEMAAYTGPVYRNMGYPNDECHIVLGMGVPNFGGKFNPDPALNEVCLPDGNSLPRMMEVDYLRVYSNRTCESDFTVCNETHLPTKIVANRVELPDPAQGNCSVTVRNEHQVKLQHPYNYHPTEIFSDAQNIEVIASDQIKLNPGFKTEPGVTFSARIEDCYEADLRSPETPVQNGYQHIVLQLKPDGDTLSIPVTNQFDLEVIPNPNTGRFTTKFPDLLNGETGTIFVIDALGNQVYQTGFFEINKEMVIQQEFEAGIYFILLQTKSQKWMHKKVVVL